MTLPALLADLEARGVALTVTGDRLIVDAPTGAVTATLRAEMVAFKPDLLRLLPALRIFDGEVVAVAPRLPPCAAPGARRRSWPVTRVPRSGGGRKMPGGLLMPRNRETSTVKRVTVRQAARHVRVTETTIQDWIAAGSLPRAAVRIALPTLEQVAVRHGASETRQACFPWA